MTTIDFPTTAEVEQLLRRELPSPERPYAPGSLGTILAAYTPGPWRVGSDEACDIGNPVAVMIGPDGNANSDVLVGCSGDWGYSPDPHANARLVAAAPALLLATLALIGRLAPLRNAAKRAGMPFDHDGTLDVLENAIRVVGRVGS